MSSYSRYLGYSARRPSVRRSTTKRYRRSYRHAPFPSPRRAMLAARAPATEIKSYDLTYAAADTPSHLLDFTTISGTDFSSATGMTCLNLIGSGTGFWNRIGSKITMISCDLNLVFSTIATKPSAVRVMLVYDKQPNSAYPLIGDVVFPNNVGNVMFGSFVRNPNQKRYHVLRDKEFFLSASTLAYTYREHITFRLPAMYLGVESDVNASIVDLSEGSLLLLFGCLTPDNTGPFINSVSSRIKYLD